MSRNHFDEILSKLHCAYNNSIPESDRFGKVRPLIKHLNDKYLEHWPVSQKISIDESMIPQLWASWLQATYPWQASQIRFKNLEYEWIHWWLLHPTGTLAGCWVRHKNCSDWSWWICCGWLDFYLPPDLHFQIHTDNFFSSLSLGTPEQSARTEHRSAQSCQTWRSQKKSWGSRLQTGYSQQLAFNKVARQRCSVCCQQLPRYQATQQCSPVVR